MRSARHAARATLIAGVLAALLVSLLPALPAVARGPVKVTGREVHTSVDHQRVVPLPIEASHVALKWRGAKDATVSVAFGLKPNALGEEVPVPIDDDEQGPDPDQVQAHGRTDPGNETYSDVLWTGGARFVRVTTSRPLAQLGVLAIDARADIGLAPAPTAVADAAVDQPTILPRSAWGADESLRFDGGGHETWPAEYYPLQVAIVHHTAGRNHDPNPAATIRAIYWAKAISRGYGDIGYNFLIDEAGHIYEGRHARDYAPGEMPTGEDLAGNVVRGVHARSHNIGTVGIALLGNFQKVQPTTAARTALERLLAWKLERHGLDPLGKTTYTNPALSQQLNIISGHRNVDATACPGETFYPTFPQLRQRVASRIAATTGPGHDTNPPTVDSFSSLMRSPTGSETIDFGLVFHEPVAGLEAGDFDVRGSSHGWTITDVRGGPEGYTIEVSADHPDAGTVHLDLATDAVTDLAGLAGPAGPASAEAEFAHDPDAPSVVLYHEPHRQYIRDGALNYFNVTATFSEPVIGFQPGDVLLGGTSDAADPWDVPEIFGEPGGATYGFSVVNHSWLNGTLTFQIPDGAVTDLAGNPVSASNVIKVYLDVGKPTTSGPRPFLRSGVTLGTGQRVLISWSGTDVGPSGIASYDVARSIDGGMFHTVASGVTTPPIFWGLTSGHAYRYEVRAHDKAGNVGYWRTGPTFRPSVAQQNNSLVTFVGPTTGVFSSHYSGGSERALAAGSSATLKATARSLSFVTAKGPGRGQVAIYVDGVHEATIDLAAASSTYRYVAFSRTWYSAGTHTIKVVAVGGRVDVDAFGIIR
ncbi:MAG TPA: N-acetylmuramoyl-L-alanine amidase [Patescibacteria group bacterium]|nr:N-acetylmuramoyl-L-alanine amidase [Patescibacteria group bacterium]